jgi:hypothetical protein
MYGKTLTGFKDEVDQDGRVVGPRLRRDEASQTTSFPASRRTRRGSADASASL